MRAPFLALAAILTLAGCQANKPEKPAVSDAWVRLAAVPGRPAAAYFTLKGGAKADTLISVYSAVVGKIELHESMMRGATMTMQPIARVDLAPGATIEFEPGGGHAMLFDVDPRITPGTAIPMRFTFASGTVVSAEAKTVPAGGDADHMQH